MIYNPAHTENKHRAINADTAPLTLTRRLCACGGQVTKAQQERHGKCAKCQLADRAAMLEPGDIDILRHMLGANGPRSRWGFRNEYLANRRDLPALERLVAAGFVRAGEQLLQLRYFHATAAGCKLAGLTVKRAAVALGARP